MDEPVDAHNDERKPHDEDPGSLMPKELIKEEPIEYIRDHEEEMLRFEFSSTTDPSPSKQV